MSEFGNNLSSSIFSAIKKMGKQAKEMFTKGTQVDSQAKDVQKPQNTPLQSLVDTKSNIPVNQPTLTSTVMTQGALNTSSEPQIILTSNLKQTSSNAQTQSTPSQVEFQGPKDLPAYAGVSNMSLKSWIAGHDNKSQSQTETGEKLLASTLDAIKGFQKQNYEGFDTDSDGKKGNKGYKQLSRNKKLLILSHIFSNFEQSGSQDTELLVNILNFKKLGSVLKDKDSLSQEEHSDIKLQPPIPDEIQKPDKIDLKQIKYLNQLLALPFEFPECLRLFAKENIELNPKELNSFLLQRIKVLQSQFSGNETAVNSAISNFVPLLNQNNYTILLPLTLLYYPLPFPDVIERYDFLKEWEKGKKDKSKSENIIASCEIYFRSKKRGRFLFKFILNDKNEFSFDVQTATENNGIIKDLEFAISESMYLLEYPPLLSELNVLLTEEVYKATEDKNEELSIVSTGPIRLEIVLAVYSTLIVLNKLKEEIDPAGLIEMDSDN